MGQSYTPAQGFNQVVVYGSNTLTSNFFEWDVNGDVLPANSGTGQGLKEYAPGMIGAYAVATGTYDLDGADSGLTIFQTDTLHLEINSAIVWECEEALLDNFKITNVVDGLVSWAAHWTLLNGFDDVDGNPVTNPNT